MPLIPSRQPQTWLEQIWSIYDPYKYMLQWQSYGTTITVGAGNVNGGLIQPPEPAYIMGFNSSGWRTGDGGSAQFPYRIGIADPSGNDWTNGAWASRNITNSDRWSDGVLDHKSEWRVPREVKENQILTVSVQNNVNAAAPAITVDGVIWGYTPRPRARPLQPVRDVQYVPQTWEEFAWSMVDPSTNGIFRQTYGCTIDAGAGLAGQTNKIQVPNDIFVFGWSVAGWVKATGASPTWPFRVGIKNATFNDWTYGQWASAALVGTGGRPNSIGGPEWILPREVARNEVLTVTVDNNVNAASEEILVDINIFGYELRERSIRALNLLSE